MPLRSYKPMSRESEKGKAKRLAFEAAERRVLKRAGGKCEVKWEGVCVGRATTAHHRLARSQGGSNDDDNLAAICWACHSECHGRPIEAAAAGHSVRREGTGLSEAKSFEREG